jgi:hypothetical protein
VCVSPLTTSRGATRPHSRIRSSDSSSSLSTLTGQTRGVVILESDKDNSGTARCQQPTATRSRRRVRTGSRSLYNRVEFRGTRWTQSGRMTTSRTGQRRIQTPWQGEGRGSEPRLPLHSSRSGAISFTTSVHIGFCLTAWTDWFALALLRGAPFARRVAIVQTLSANGRARANQRTFERSIDHLDEAYRTRSPSAASRLPTIAPIVRTRGGHWQAGQGCLAPAARPRLLR